MSLAKQLKSKMSEYQFEFDPYYVVPEEYEIDVPKLTLFKQDSFEMNFDCPSTQQPIQQNFVYDIFQDNTLNIENGAAKKIQKKPIKKQKPAQRDYKKNICRNILRHAIKSMLNCEICQDFMEGLVDDTDSFKQYYNRVLESITGFRVLKDQLVNSASDSELVKNRKKAFKIYLTWYLRTRASQMILLGETKNPMEYIKYKNEVLLYYVQSPQEWNSNTPDWKNHSPTGDTQRCWEDRDQMHA